MRKFFLFFFLVGCSYNYHLGEKLELEKKFEEASLEYSRAYLRSPSNRKYRIAYQRSAQETVKVFKENYRRQVINQNFFSAYRILEKGLILIADDIFFLKEQKKWRYILLTGKIDYPKGDDLSRLVVGEKIYPVIQFIVPNSEEIIEATLEIDGSFFLEDLIYTPSDEDYLRYSMNNIGFKYLSFQARQKSLIQTSDFNYLTIVNFYNPKLLNHQGVFKDSNLARLKITNDPSYWYPQRGITYTSKIQENKVFIETNSPQISFLPNTLYKKEQRVILDFGMISLQKKKGSFLWGVRQEANNELAKNIKNHYYYRIYEKTLINPYSFFIHQ